MEASRRFRLLVGLCMVFVASLGRAIAADDYPNKPLRLITLAGAGATDIAARTFAQELSKRIGQPMVVEPRPGAAGNIAMEAAAKSAPDGYTLVMITRAVVNVNPFLFKNLPYNPQRDFVPVAYLASMPMVLTVNQDMPVKSLREFIRLAQAKPGSMNYGTSGNAQTSHLAMELLKRRAGIDLVHVPYKGEALAITDLLGGRLSAVLPTLTVALPHIRSGRLRALGLASRERSPLAPDIPTMSEAGIPDFEVTAWFGVLAPAGTPKPVVDRLSREFNAIANDADTRARLIAVGIEPGSMSSAVFGKWMRDETELWRKVVTDAGIRAD